MITVMVSELHFSFLFLFFFIFLLPLPLYSSAAVGRVKNGEGSSETWAVGPSSLGRCFFKKKEKKRYSS
jgi:hypothetical protein